MNDEPQVPEPMPRVSRAFRVVLRREVSQWLAGGIVDAPAAARLEARYALGELPKETGHRVATSIFTIGSLLIGGGIIAFVAAHWTRIPVAGQAVLLFTTHLALHGIGFAFVRNGRSPRLGDAVILAGSLAFGANLALLGQMYQIQRDQPAWMAAWSLGALAVAVARPSALHGLLALVTSFLWFVGTMGDHPGTWPVYALFVAVAVLPVARATRSLALALLAWIALGLATVIGTGADVETRAATALAAVLASLLVWSAGHLLRSTRDDSWGFPTSLLGAVGLAITAYVLSFRELHRETSAPDDPRWTVALLAVAGVVAALVIAGWMRRPLDGARRATAIALLASGVLLEVSVLVTGVFGPALANAAALAIAAVGVGNGVREESRAAFWLGTLFAVLLVLTRFFEYESSLLTKSLVFIACGVVVVFVGVRFERHLRAREVAHA